jgi:hypothetical protein
MTSISAKARFNSRLLVAACGLLAGLGSGCTQTPLCEESSSCGGPIPYGNWALDPSGESCQEDLYTPTVDTRLLGGEVPAARTPTLEPDLFDWCNLLVAGSGTTILLKSPLFYYESGRVGAVTLAYHEDGTFSAGITRTGTFTLDFPATCMRAFGATDNRPLNPDDPASPVGNVCKQLEIPLAKSGAGEGSYQNTTCDPNPQDPLGCLCTFDVTETGGPGGRFEVLDSTTLIHYTNSNFPSKVSYCNQGNTLELTGADGAWLYNFGGLRTLRLHANVAAPVTP